MTILTILIVQKKMQNRFERFYKQIRFPVICTRIQGWFPQKSINKNPGLGLIKRRFKNKFTNPETHRIRVVNSLIRGNEIAKDGA